MAPSSSRTCLLAGCLGLAALCASPVSARGLPGLATGSGWVPRRARALMVRGGEDTETVMHPGLTEDEALQKLNTIPVFGITDKDGNSVILKTADGKQVNWLFLQKEAADSMHEFIQSQSPDLNLRINDIPLGLVYRRLSKPEEAQGENYKDPAADEAVEVRLLADRTDVAAALNMTISNGQNITEDRQALYAQKVKLLNASWGVVPVFTMAHMKMKVNNGTEAIELRPWFLSVAGCVESFRNALERSGEPLDSLDSAALHVSTLDELLEAMQKESAFDFRNVIFMPSKSSTEYLRTKVAELAKKQGLDDSLADLSAAAAGGGDKPGGSMFDDDDDDDDDGSIFG